MYRRTFNKALVAGFLLPVTGIKSAFASDSKQTNHVIKLLSNAPKSQETGKSGEMCGDVEKKSPSEATTKRHTDFFAPDLLEIKPGDSVTFLPTDKGHNTAAKRGMVPDGVERWNSGIDKEFTVTLTEPGVYGYVCMPHYVMGMVGLIVVRENPTDELPNLAKAKKVRHPSAAKKVFKQLFAQLEKQSKSLTK